MKNQLTDLERKIKRINSRIVQQIKTYGLNNFLIQDYISDLYGQTFVKDVNRKIGTDSQGNNIYMKVPQIVGSRKNISSNFINAFEKKKTPGRELINLKNELKQLRKENKELKDTIDKLLEDPAALQDIEKSYIEAKESMEDLIYQYYKSNEPEDIQDSDILNKLRTSDKLSKYEIVQIYKELKEEQNNNAGIGKI